MSTFVLTNKTISFATPLSVVMVAKSYTFLQSNVNLSQITSSIVDEPIQLTGKTITESGVNLKYDANDLVYITPTGVNVGALYIYETATGKLIYYLTSDEIKPQGANLGFIFNASGIAQIFNVIPRQTWVQSKFDALSGTDYNPSVTANIISQVTDNNTLFAVPFTKSAVGFIRAISPSGSIYDNFISVLTTASGTDYNSALTQQRIDATDFDTTLFMIPFTSGRVGFISSIMVNPTVYPVTAQYDFSTIGYPDLTVTKDSTTQNTITCNNLPSGYGIRLFRANSYSGSQGKFDSNLGDLESGDLPYVDSGLTASNAYKYAAYFITDGEIDTVPTTYKGGIGQARYTTVTDRIL